MPERGPFRRAWPSLLIAALACAGPETGDQIVVEIRADDVSSPPEHLLLSWLDDQRFLLRDERVPAAGRLAPTADRLAEVHVALEGARRGQRRVIIRGVSAGTVVSEGVAQIDLGGSGADRMMVVLREGRLPDIDDNGIPDEIDACDGVRVEGGLCLRGERPPPDAGAIADGVTDSAPDASAIGADAATAPDATAPAADSGPPAPADAGAEPDATPASPDAPAPDAAPVDTAASAPPDAPGPSTDAAPAVTNVIRNPGFEEGTAGWLLINGDATTGGAVAPGRTGQRHLRETSRWGWWQQTLGSGTWMPGGRYRFVAWGRSNVAGCRAGIKTGVTGATAFEKQLIGFGADWTMLSTSVTLPTDARWAVVFVTVGDKAGTCEVDDLAVFAE